MTLDMFLQHCFNALTLGSLYALIAIGYTMVYGILRLINFAHGDILMVGAYFVFFRHFRLWLALGCGRHHRHPRRQRAGCGGGTRGLPALA